MSGTSQYNKILIQISSGKTAGSIIVIDKNDRKVYDQQSLDRPSDTPQDQRICEYASQVQGYDGE